MSIYPPNVTERFLRPRNCGTLKQASATGIGASFECGAYTRIALRIDEGSGTIESVRFSTNGCGYMVAASDMLADLLKTKELTELGGFDTEAAVRKLEIAGLELPGSRRQCALVALEAAKAALADYRSRRVEEFTGDKALICTCFGVSEDSIATLIAGKSLSDVEEVSNLSRAGSG